MLVERPPRAVEGKVYLVSVPLATLLDCTFSREGMMVGNDVVKEQVSMSSSMIGYARNDRSEVDVDGWWSDEHVAVLVGNQVEAAHTRLTSISPQSTDVNVGLRTGLRRFDRYLPLRYCTAEYTCNIYSASSSV